MLKVVIYLLAIGLLGPLSKAANAAEGNYLVLGVIASSGDRAGVALMKDIYSGKTFAVREGSEFAKAYLLKAVDRKFVSLVINDKTYKLEVGDDTQSAVSSRSFVLTNATPEIEIQDNVVRVSRRYKEHLVADKIPEILMQAAAIPHLVNGKLAGFQLWEIEKNSLFDDAKLVNGDIITGINGYEITDVGSTIKQLRSLKDAEEASFEYLRDGQKKTLKVLIQ